MYKQESVVRGYARQLVREWGMLDARKGFEGLGYAECHVLLEAKLRKRVCVSELVAVLCMDKSGVSRTVASLEKSGFLKREPDGVDKRKQWCVLTAKGRKKADAIDQHSDQRVARALGVLSEEERCVVERGLSLYVQAWVRTRDVAAEEEVTVVPYQSVYQDEVIRLVLGIQNGEFGVPVTLSDQPDLQQIESYYFKGKGHFWVALCGGRVVGTCGLWAFSEHEAALRKMFVAAPFRGSHKGVSALLMKAMEEWCKRVGVQHVYLGTVEVLKAAHRFYEKCGFEAVSVAQLPKGFPKMQVDTRFYAKRLSQSFG